MSASPALSALSLDLKEAYRAAFVASTHTANILTTYIKTNNTTAQSSSDSTTVTTSFKPHSDSLLLQKSGRGTAKRPS
jgi:hypothetical protein